MESREINSEARADPDRNEAEIDLYEDLSVFLALSPEEQRLYMEQPENAAQDITEELIAESLSGDIELVPAPPVEKPCEPEPAEMAQAADASFWFMTDTLAQTSFEPIGPGLEVVSRPAPETADFGASPLDLFSEEPAVQVAKSQAYGQEEVLSLTGELVMPPMSQTANAVLELADEPLANSAPQVATPLGISDDSLLDEFLQVTETPFDREETPRQSVEPGAEHEWDLDFDSLASGAVTEVKEELPAVRANEPVEPAPITSERIEVWATGELLPSLRPSASAQETVRCSVCGSPADSADLFCVACGAFFDEAEPLSARAQACEDCGAAITADELFCPSCGSVTSVA